MPTQSKIGWRPYVNPSITASSLWNSIYSVYNADAVGSSSLKTSLYAAYNGESNTNDSKGTNNGTAVGGLTYGTGKVGTAFQFNGSNAYVSLPVNNFNFTGDFSISCWFKTSTVSGNQMIFSNLMYNGGARKGYYIALLGDTVYVWLANTLSFQQNISTSSIISINTWYNIVVTRESGFVKLYVNNSLIVTDTNAITMEYVYTTPSIGAYTNGATTMWHFNGIVDALNVWQKSLTQSEITELYNSGNGAQYIGDNFYKPTTNDALNTNNGTAVGGLTYGLGKVGTAFQFNGTNALVSLPDNSLNLTGDFTVSGWVYVSNSGPQAILENSYYRTTPSYNYSGWGIFIDISGTSTRKLGFIIPRGTTNSYLGWQFETTQLTLNTWNHIVITRVSGVNTYAWINNIAQSYITLGPEPSSSININSVYTSTQKCTIGASNGGTSQGNFMKSNSQIDSLTIWNRQLTSEERTQLYNSGNGKQYPN